MTRKRKSTVSNEVGTWIAFDHDGIIGISEESSRAAVEALDASCGSQATAVVFIPADVYEKEALVPQFSVVPR